MIYNVVLVSGVQQSDSVIHIHIYSFLDSFPLSDQVFWIIFGLTDGIGNLPGPCVSYALAGYAKNAKPRLLFIRAISEGFCWGDVPNNELALLATHYKSRKSSSSTFLSCNTTLFIHLGTCAAPVGTRSRGEPHEYHTDTLPTAFALRNKVLSL